MSGVDTATPTGTEALSWTVRLSDKEPWKRWVVFGAALFAAAVGQLLMGSVLFALIGFVAILGATTDYWLPVKYRIDEGGCSLKCGFSVSSIDWPDVKRVLLDDEGAKISPLAEDTRLSPFRGVYLRFAGNREQVVEALERFSHNDVRFLESGADGGGDAGTHPQSSRGDQEAPDGDAGESRAGDAQAP